MLPLTSVKTNVLYIYLLQYRRCILVMLHTSYQETEITVNKTMRYRKLAH